MRNVKNKLISTILLALGVLNIGYFILLQILSPGTFLTAITSFSMIWLVFGLFCIILGAVQFKHEKILWLKLSATVQKIICAVVALGVIIAVSCLYFILTPRLASEAKEVDYLIILGGGITKNNTLSDVPQSRIEKAAEYMKIHPNTKAVVTGGIGRFTTNSEAPVLKQALAACGIEANRIFEEDQARDTIQNFQYSVQIIAQNSGKDAAQIMRQPLAVITSDFHLSRAERLAARMGFTDVYGIASKTPASFILNSYSREIAAYIKLNLRILLTGKPKKIL